jgi:hypothetical protein
MADLTYVSLVPKENTGRLRQVLSEEDTGALVWREVRTGWGSEFYFSGPSELARCTHEFVTLWVANQKLAKSVGKAADAPRDRPWRSGLMRRSAAAAALIVFAVVAFHGGGALG